MPRRSPADLANEDGQILLERLSLDGRGAPSLEERLEIVQTLRSRGGEWGATLDRWWLRELARLRGGLAEARVHHDALKGLLDELSAPPWHPAVYLGSTTTGRGPAACVAHGGAVRVVAVASEIEAASLAVGDDVLLNKDLTTVVRPSALPMTHGGETAVFDRLLADGRLIVRQRDEEVVARPAAALDVGALKCGDLLRWDRSLGLAFEKLDRARDSALFIDEAPRDAFEVVGGLDRQIQELQRSLLLRMRHLDLAHKYKLRRAKSVLLVGPPGAGKTLLARALAGWLGRQSPAGRVRFMHVKPSALSSMWYGQSEANYRETFRAAREASVADPDTPVVMFFDEVDAIGAARSNGALRIDDRVMTSFMAELDGFDSRGDVLVVAATNRPDALDPALLRPGRLGDLVLEIPRPNMAAAAAIFEKHLPADIPYAGAGDSDARRRALIAAAVSRLYAPNGEGEIAAITFRDNSRRPVHARDIISGASIAKIARVAVEQACQREVEGGASGVDLRDVLDAIDGELLTAVGALTPANCHAFISDLPQDLVVVRVEPALRRPRRPHRFFSAA